MKKRLFCIITAALLLAGCDDSVKVPETVETTEHTTTATTTETTPSTTADTTPTETTTLPQDNNTGGVTLDSTVLTAEQKELRKLVSGAREFCDFEELGVAFTQSNDFVSRALTIAAQKEGFDTNYSERDFGKTLGYDDGNYYFSLYTVYGDSQNDYFNNISGEVETIYGVPQNRYEYDYFCLDCNSGELTQIYPPQSSDTIRKISNEAMLIRNNDIYRLVHRESGCEKQLPENSINHVLIDNKVFYELSSDELYLTFSIAWCEVTESHGYFNDASISPKAFEPFYITRGVHNIVYYEDSAVYCDLNGNHYLYGDPLGRVRDFVTNTYYRGSATMQSSLLGWRTRLSITDRNKKEYFIGDIQTEFKTIGYGLMLYSTKDGLIFLKIPDTQPIILLGEENDFSNMKAAFLPEEMLPDHYDIYCDNSTIYLIDQDDHREICTLSRKSS